MLVANVYLSEVVPVSEKAQNTVVYVESGGD